MPTKITNPTRSHTPHPGASDKGEHAQSKRAGQTKHAKGHTKHAAGPTKHATGQTKQAEGPNKAPHKGRDFGTH